MTLVTIVLLAMALILGFIAYRRGDGSHRTGLVRGLKLLISLLPLLISAFLVAGFIEVVVPRSLVEAWLGESAGFKGLLIGSVSGALLPGGPYVTFPIIASVYRAGAGLGTTVSFITGWATWGLGALAFELALMGPRFSVVRISVTALFPPLAGFLAQLLFGSLV